MTKQCIDKTRLIAKMQSNRVDLPGTGAILGKFYIVCRNGIRFLKSLAEVEGIFRAEGPARWGRYV